MQPFFGRLEPRLEAVPVPVLRLDQWPGGRVNRRQFLFGSPQLEGEVFGLTLPLSLLGRADEVIE